VVAELHAAVHPNHLGNNRGGAMRVWFALVCLGLTFGFATPSWASGPHPVVDPRQLTFSPSPDDDVTGADGNPLVDHYALAIFVLGSDTPFETVSLGKPPADDEGRVRLRLLPLLYAPLTPGVAYQAVVQAVGPGGTADSEPSNAFVISEPPCDPWISPVTLEDVDAAGGSHAITVNVRAGCEWTAASNDSWLTITSGQSGSGTGVVTFTVAPNTGKNNRKGTLTVAGAKFTVRQDGARQNR
jgi:hypothetical protein